MHAADRLTAGAGGPDLAAVETGVARWLAEAGCRTAFVVPSRHTESLIEALAEAGVALVAAQSELGAAFMADGAARATSRISACVVGGPGAAYATAGAITARIDHSPVVFLTGRPPPDQDPGFQTVGAAGSRDRAVLGAALDRSEALVPAARLKAALARAQASLTGEPPSPVHLGLSAEAPAAPLRRLLGKGRVERAALTAFLATPRAALLVGRGCVAEGAGELVRRAAERHGLPILTTAGAKGVVPEDHPLCLGPVGHSATLWARAASAPGGLDAVLRLGLDDDEAGPCASLVLTQRYDGAGPLAAGCATVAQALLDTAPAAEADARAAWIERLCLGGRTIDPPPADPSAPVHPGRLVRTLQAAQPPGARLVCDAGLCRRFVGHHWIARAPRELLVAARTAPMGWALAAGVGAAAADPSARTVVLTGDGSMRMLGMELATAAVRRLPITTVVADNGVLGSVALRSRLRPGAPALGASPPIDWAGFATALGLAAWSVTDASGLRAALDAAHADARPGLVVVRTALADLEPGAAWG